MFIIFDEGNGPQTCADYNPDTGAGTTPNSLLPVAKCYDSKNFDEKVVLIAATTYGVTGIVDHRFHSHFSLLKTVEAAFALPFIGHAADATTLTLAPLLQPSDDRE